MNLACGSWWRMQWDRLQAWWAPADDVVSTHTRRLWDRKGY